jgi:phospholipase D1/2
VSLSVSSVCHVSQFFIGDLAGTDVKNSIARAILDRVVLAAHRREAFKAIIIVPVHPEGDYVGSSGPLGVMNYQYKTISRGGTSFLEQFQKYTRGQVNPMDYFCFCSLRNWGDLDGKLVLDQIYVHDKVGTHPASLSLFILTVTLLLGQLLIVDDRIMIMGSANVNDRSMLGERDTEVNPSLHTPELSFL